jgi:hypothetical protein
MDLMLPTPQFPLHRCWHQWEPGRGALGKRVGEVLHTPLMAELGSPVFFNDVMCVLARIITSPKSMVRQPFKYLLDYFGGGIHNGALKIEGGGVNGVRCLWRIFKFACQTYLANSIVEYYLFPNNLALHSIHSESTGSPLFELEREQLIDQQEGTFNICYF